MFSVLGFSDLVGSTRSGPNQRVHGGDRREKPTDKSGSQRDEGSPGHSGWGQPGRWAGVGEAAENGTPPDRRRDCLRRVPGGASRQPPGAEGVRREGRPKPVSSLGKPNREPARVEGYAVARHREGIRRIKKSAAVCKSGDRRFPGQSEWCRSVRGERTMREAGENRGSHPLKEAPLDSSQTAPDLEQSQYR